MAVTRRTKRLAVVRRADAGCAHAQAGKLRRYWAVVAVFLVNIYTNMMALKSSNVETVIVFRSVTTVRETEILVEQQPYSVIMLVL